MTHPQPEKLRPAWPLFTAAVLAFIPVLGVFFGAFAATWGLVSSRRRAIVAAAIAMTGALLNIAGIIIFSLKSGAGSGGAGMRRVHADLARRDMVKLVVALDAYHARERGYPSTLEALPGHMGAFRVGLLDQSAGVFRAIADYQYHMSPDGESYDLFGVGPDNKPGTADDVRPALPDSIKAHTGYLPAGGPKP
jgi:hypothetical protein